jgi:hypothetical protein
MTYIREHTSTAAVWIRSWRAAAPFEVEISRSPNFTMTCGSVVPSFALDTVAKLKARALWLTSPALEILDVTWDGPRAGRSAHHLSFIGPPRVFRQ